MNKIMSIDASTKSTGIAIYSDNNLIYHTCITNSNTDTYKRIKEMWNNIKKIYEQYEIDTIIMEDILPEDVKHNQTVFKTLMYLQSWIILNFHEYKQSVFLISANSWRKKCGITIGRYGTREIVKQQSINFIKEKYNILVNDDEADAICILTAYLDGAATPIINNKMKPIGSDKSAF